VQDTTTTAAVTIKLNGDQAARSIHTPQVWHLERQCRFTASSPNPLL